MRFHAENIAFGYEDGPHFQDLSLELPENSLTCLIGPNGSGKSSFLKALLGLLPLERGRILLDGQEIASMTRKAIASRIAYVSQSGMAAPVSVYEAVLMGRIPYIRCFPGRQDHHAVLEALERLSIADWKDRLLSELSGGECQKVFLAKALAQDTPLIFLDEPTKALDIRWQYELYGLFRQLTTEGGRQLLVVEHDLVLASRFADSVYVLKDGRARAFGKPQDILTPGLLKDVYSIDAVVTGSGLLVSGTSTPEVA